MEEVPNSAAALGNWSTVLHTLPLLPGFGVLISLRSKCLGGEGQLPALPLLPPGLGWRNPWVSGQVSRSSPLEISPNFLLSPCALLRLASGPVDPTLLGPLE